MPSENWRNIRRIHVLDWGYATRLLVVTRDDDVFFVGCPSHELRWSLVEEPRTEVLNSKRWTKKETLCGQKIKSFAHSNNMKFAALSESGQVFAWENNGTARLVAGELENEKVVQVVCGQNHLLALTDQGELFIWDWNSLLGGWSTDTVWLDRLTLSNSNYKAVAIASNRDTEFYILLEGGQLHIWDRDRKTPSERMEIDPSIGPFAPPSFRRFHFSRNNKFKQVVGGHCHCLALTDSGQIFAVGCNTYGQTGIDGPQRLKTPQLVNHQFGEAVQIAACTDRSAAKFADGTVRTWGDRMAKQKIWRKDRCIYYRFHHWVECSSWPFPLESDSWIKCGSWIESSSIDEAFAPFSTWRTLDLNLLVPKTVAERLGLELNDKKAVDICFQVRGKQIWAHKRVLKPALPYFDTMFQPRWSDPEKTYVEVRHYSYKTFYAFLHYLYTEELTKNVNLKYLRRVARFYGHDELQQICL